ncbi:MAG: TMEM43 family protein [Bacteroidaceae bacterium]|nr:TMEM43 family protein [Bacteroidaceae bacterium]
MAYTETKTTSYGSRVKNSFGGILVGILLFIGGTILLWWNEGRAVRTADAIKDAEKNLVDMNDISKIDNSFNGKLVHSTGTAIAHDQLYDGSFEIKTNATKLIRDVNYYQWIENKKEETKDKFGGGQETVVTYTYSREWTRNPVNSNDFNQSAVSEESRNMGTKIYNFTVCGNLESTSIVAKDVTFGAYKLPDFLISSISGSEAFDVTLSDEIQGKYDELVRKAYVDNGRQVISKSNQVASNVVSKPEVQEVADSVEAKNDSIDVPTEWEKTEYDYIHISGNTIYLGENPNNPEVGDVMIKYNVVPAQNDISLIAQIENNTYTPYVAGNGEKFSRLDMGVKSGAEMIQGAKDDNTMMTWILRLVGIVLVIIGIKGVLNIFVTLAKIIPFISSILNFGANVIAFIFGLVWSLIIIAIAWLFYRPLLAICILLVIGGIVFLAVKYGKKKSVKKEAAEA